MNVIINRARFPKSNAVFVLNLRFKTGCNSRFGFMAVVQFLSVEISREYEKERKVWKLGYEPPRLNWLLEFLNFKVYG